MVKKLYGWSSDQTYTFSIHKATGKILAEIRKEYMEAQNGPLSINMYNRFSKKIQKRK